MKLINFIKNRNECLKIKMFECASHQYLQYRVRVCAWQSGAKVTTSSFGTKLTPVSNNNDVQTFRIMVQVLYGIESRKYY